MPSAPIRPSIEERLRLHRDYWERRPLPRPLCAYWLSPDFFLSKHFKAAHPLLKSGKTITPDLVVVDAFLPDYERLFQETEAIGQDAFWTAEPYNSLPWMEAMLGCEVMGSPDAFVSKHLLDDPAELEKIEVRPDNPWLLKFLEFTEKLVKLSRGRFTVGQPITRGPADMMGALLGQAEMVLAQADEPEFMQRMFVKLAEIQRWILKEHKKLIPPFHGGQALGFYHVWTPGPSVWYQEDLSAIMSPEMYRDFLRPAEKILTAGYDYTAVHLHPASFFMLDDLLENDFLRAIQVNKDVGGPSVPQMIPEFKKITARKNLIIWGDLTLEDLACLRENLAPVGLFFFIVVKDLAEAAATQKFIHAWRE